VDNKTNASSTVRFDKGIDMGSVKLPNRIARVDSWSNFNEPTLVLGRPDSREKYFLPIDVWTDKRGVVRGLYTFLKNPKFSGTDCYRRNVRDKVVRALPTDTGVTFRVFGDEGNGDVVDRFDLSNEDIQVVLAAYEFFMVLFKKHVKYYLPATTVVAGGTKPAGDSSVAPLVNGVVAETSPDQSPIADTVAK